jgi:serine/threonine protein phosphatase PrpC
LTVLRSGSATDVGRVRPINQDMPLERPNLYAVADGMGGHVGGEVAARVAVETLEQAFERAPTLDGLREAFSEANAAVWHESQSNADLRGMGTTLTAVALVGGDEGKDTLALANVGDSRAYVYSDGRLFQVTADHSLAEERMRQGEMTEAEAAVHPQRHILTRALGVSSEVEADMWELQLRSGDRVLLCSDGLSNEVGMDEISGILGDVSDPGEAAGQLVDAANKHGGADNITVVIVDVQVGEDGTPEGASKVVPIGAGTTAITMASAAATAAVAAVPNGAIPSSTVEEVGPDDESGDGDADAPSDMTQTLTRSDLAPLPAFTDADTLAPGARLGFGGETTSLGEEGPRSDEFFVGSGAVSVARTSTRVPLAERTPAPTDISRKRKEEESRRERRRRLGVPRRVTFRVLGFVILVAAVPVAAYFVIRWYAYDNWIVTLHGDQVVIVQGQQGGVLWFHPKVVDRTGVTKDQLSVAAANALVFGVQKSSLHDAKTYLSSVTTTSTTTTTTTTTTTVPNGSTTTTTTQPAGAAGGPG